MKGSLMATMSTLPEFKAALVTRRLMRPNPFTPTFTILSQRCGWRSTKVTAICRTGRSRELKTDLFYKQTSLNLVVFDKNEGNFREKKIFQKNVKSQFVNRGLHVVRLISRIVLCCYVILMWKFVSEAYLSNLSLDEDQMPHDLQPGLEKDII